jgi:hypothetical protein
VLLSATTALVEAAEFLTEHHSQNLTRGGATATLTDSRAQAEDRASGLRYPHSRFAPVARLRDAQIANLKARGTC